MFCRVGSLTATARLGSSIFTNRIHHTILNQTMSTGKKEQDAGALPAQSHYRKPGLLESILDHLAKSGKNTDHLNLEDLSGIDEFHTGGAPATHAVAEAMKLKAGSKVLDIGSGAGGPARHFASRGHKVVGIDITPEFVSTASELTARVGLSDQVEFVQGSALELPFADATFGGACMFHVGMNISSKDLLFGEVRRVVAKDGVFGIFDVMRLKEGEIAYPTPWATSQESSFVCTPQEYRNLLEKAGFQVIEEGLKMDLARSGAPPPILLSDPGRLANMRLLMQSAVAGPYMMICKAV